MAKQPTKLNEHIARERIEQIDRMFENALSEQPAMRECAEEMERLVEATRKDVARDTPTYKHRAAIYTLAAQMFRERDSALSAKLKGAEAVRVAALEEAAKLFDADRDDALRQIEANMAYTRRIGRGDDTWSKSNELCRDRARFNEGAITRIRSLASKPGDAR